MECYFLGFALFCFGAIGGWTWRDIRATEEKVLQDIAKFEGKDNK